MIHVRLFRRESTPPLMIDSFIFFDFIIGYIPEKVTLISIYLICVHCFTFVVSGIPTVIRYPLKLQQSNVFTCGRMIIMMMIIIISLNPPFSCIESISEVFFAGTLWAH